MKKLLTVTSLLCMSLSFIACNQHKEPEFDSSIVTKTKENTVDSNSATQNNVVAEPGNITPEQLSTVQATTQPVAAGLNPAHGQPGHRCDIAVGAPLNSPAAPASAQTQVQPATQTITPTMTTAKTVTAPGMNPAHGEPGHRCDIAVGAPLNSPAPAKADASATADKLSIEKKEAAPQPAQAVETPAGIIKSDK